VPNPDPGEDLAFVDVAERSSHHIENSEPASHTPELSREELSALAAESGSGAYVSLFMPVHHDGRQTRQNAIRLGNLVRDADARLRDRGISEAERHDIMASLQRQIGNAESWWKYRVGVGLFATEGTAHAFSLPRPPKEMVIVADRYYITPIVPLLEKVEFAVLTLSQHDVRFYEAVGKSFVERPLPNTPSRLEDVVGTELEGGSLQLHAAGAPRRGGFAPAVFHGHGAGHDDVLGELERFLRAVDTGLWQDLPNRNLPIVLTGVERNVTLFQQLTRLPNVMTQAITGDAKSYTPAALHAAAWAIVEPVVHAARLRAKADIEERANTAWVVSDLGEILRSAQEGRLATLFVAECHAIWGHFDPDDRHLEVRAQAPAPSDEDLLERALREALWQGTTLYVVPIDEMPCRKPIIASVRFERA